MLSERTELLIQRHTAFQEIAIARLPKYGKCLFLDGDLQSAESDQEQYHRALVEPAFNYNPNIKSALILGGGERATAKKVLTHPDIERVTMVDIDEELVKICAEHLSEWCGEIHDPRLSIHYQDAGEFVPNDISRYDLIVWDLVDPYRWQNKEQTAASNLYSQEFFALIKAHLTPTGLLSIEYALRNRHQMSKLLEGWAKIGRREVYIPSFEEKWSFDLMRSSK